MSQLDQDSSSRISKPYRALRLSWQEFVGLVLELTIHAYQEMKKANVVQVDWEEDQFTVNLEKHLRRIIFDGSFAIQVQSFKKHITPDMMSGKETIKKARVMDLVLHQNWEQDSDKVHFVWEAKRVGDRRIEPNYSNLSSEYVNEAIYRFIDLKYARGLEDAGILGYVLAGEVRHIVADINQSMGRLRTRDPLPASNHLGLAQPVDQFEDIYESTHIRIDDSPIRLHHLFFTFNFLSS